MVAYEGLLAETVTYQGHNGDEIEAYFARPLGVANAPGRGRDSPRPGLG